MGRRKSDQNKGQDCQASIDSIMQALAGAMRKRGQDTFWHCTNSTQSHMEIDAVRDWAKALNNQLKKSRYIDVEPYNPKNPNDYPDCKVYDAQLGHLIGVEVVEFIWPDKSCPSAKINELIAKKDQRVFDRSKLRYLHLLIVTDASHLLDSAELQNFCSKVNIQECRNLSNIYLMTSYVPDEGYPVVTLREASSLN